MADNSGTLLIRALDSHEYTVEVWEGADTVILSNGAVVYDNGGSLTPVPVSYTDFIYKEEDDIFYKIKISTSPVTIAQLEILIQQGEQVIYAEDLNKYLPIDWFSQQSYAPSSSHYYGALRNVDGVMRVGAYMTSSTGVWGVSGNASSSSSTQVYPIYIEPVTAPSTYVRATEATSEVINFNDITSLYMTIREMDGSSLVQKQGYETINVAEEIYGKSLDLICEIWYDTHQVLEHNFTEDDAEAYAVFDSSDGSLTFFRGAAGKYTNEEVIGTKTYWTGIEENRYNEYTIPWYSYRTSVLSVNFNNEISPISLAYWFYYCVNLVEIINISNLNTSNVTNMRGTFAFCEALASLDLSNFNTSKVVNMTSMFQKCEALTSLDLSNFDTSEVTIMYDMFDSCSGLTSLDLSNFNTSKVTDMGYMFYGCEGLESINLYSFNTFNVTNMRSMFLGCINLVSLYISTFDTSNVTNMVDMFHNSTSLEQIFVGKKWDTSKVSTSSRMFTNCVNLPNFDSNYIDKTRAYYGEKDGVEGYLTLDREAYAKLEVDGFEGTLTFFTDYSGKYTNEEVIDGIRYFTGVENTGTTTASIPWHEYRIQITKVVAIDKIIPKSLCYWFYNFGRTTSIDLSNFDTSNVANMSFMFHTCFYLTSLDLSGLNTSNVTNMSHIFQGCKNLTSLDLSNFNTSKVNNMSWMFADCKNLTSLNLSNFNTSHAVDMRGMFSNVGGFNLDISNFDFSSFLNYNTVGAASMFSNSKFTSIKFPTTNCFKGNWNNAFQGAYLKQNILVDTTPYYYNDIFTDLTSDSEVYIIWNGDLSTSQNGWPGICRDYSNVHYELDDAAFTADLTKSTRGIYDSTNNEWTTDDGGEYIRFLLNYNVPTTNVPFGFSNTGNTIEFYRRDGNTPTHLNPEQGEIITDPNNSNTYYHEIDSTKLKDNYNYYGVATIQFTDGTLTLSKSATTPDITILGQFAIIDVLPKGHTIALGKVAERIYEAVSSPTGSPKDQGWYELVSGEYVLSTDETVSTGKTYYKEAPSLQIGLPMYYNEHDSYIGKILSGTSRASSTFTVTTSWQDINEILLTPGTWIIKGWVSFNGSTAGNRRILIRDQYHLTSLPEASSTNFAGYAPANTHTLVSGVVIVSISVNTIYYLKVRTDAGSPIGRYSQLQALRIL